MRTDFSVSTISFIGGREREKEIERIVRIILKEFAAVNRNEV